MHLSNKYMEWKAKVCVKDRWNDNDTATHVRTHHQKAYIIMLCYMCQQHWHCVTALYSNRGSSLADVLFHFSARIQMLTQRTRANNISANKNSRKICVYMHTDPIWSCSSGKSFQKVFLVSLVYRSDVRNTYTHSMFHRSTMNVLVRVHVCVCVQFVLLCLIMATIFHRLYSKTSTFSIDSSHRCWRHQVSLFIMPLWHWNHCFKLFECSMLTLLLIFFCSFHECGIWFWNGIYGN